MLINKKNDMIPYNMHRKPSKQYPLLLPLIWGGSYLLTRKFNLKINKINMKKIKPPYLIFSTHQGFSDYYIGPLAMFPKRCMYVSDMEGFAGFGNWIYRGIGCIPKRRYVADINVVKNIKYAISKKQSVMIFPESRHSNIGTNSYIPKNIGKLAKIMHVPIVILHINGSYLANPFWDEEHTRKVPMKATMTCIYDNDEIKCASENDIQNKIEEYLQYDEYKYQQNNNIKITEKNRAKGLHIPLYQCKNCKTKYMMKSYESYLKCNQCGKIWNLTKDGWLLSDNKKTHIPDWYEWEKRQVFDNIDKIKRSFDVHIEALPNEKGFVNLGNGILELDNKDFCLNFKDGNEIQKNIIKKITEDNKLHFLHKNRESLQTEYNYRNKGMCVVLSTKDCCYYLYSLQEDFNPTELQFISEIFRELEQN